MMIFTRLFGSLGGLLVIYYVELLLRLPDAIRHHFRISSVIVVVVSCALTVLMALWETRHLRRLLKAIQHGRAPDPDDAREAGREAVVFAARHHRHEAWLVPCSTLVPVVIYLRFWHGASLPVLTNITLTVFMGISMALMSTFFAVEHCMQSVIRHILDHGVSINYRFLPAGKLRFRLGLCSSLTITTTALMIGTLARQKAVDVVEDPDHRDEAVASLRTHTSYITIAAVITGVGYAAVMAGSVTKRIDELLAAMQRVEGGMLSERLRPAGNDEVDKLSRQFNSMVERLDQDNRTICDLNMNLEARASKRTKQFLANISHELRTPLNGVLGMSDLLLTTPLSSQQRRYALATKSAGTSLLELLNEVLDYSKIEAGMLETEKITFDLSGTIEPVIELCAHRCREKSLEIAYFADPAVPSELIGDPGRVRQILSNLLNNAVKFTERGSVAVRISLVKRVEQSVELQFSVEDSGIGIPASRFDRIFQPFSQVDASTTRKFGGTGLGLVICKNLCELMRGRIDFQSEFGKGSTFRFWLPFDVPQTISASAWSAKSHHLQGLRVLLADAGDSSRQILGEQLVGWGLNVDAVANGKEAVQKLGLAAATGAPFAIAIYDAGISDLATEEFAAAVQSAPAIAKTGLVLLVPLGKPEDAPHWRGLGFAGWVTKPAMQSALFDALINAVNAERSGAERPRALAKHSVLQQDALPRTKRQGIRILVAEDNEINQDVAVELLTRAGYECTVVSNGKLAVETLKAARFDLVLMDCQMPEMDGLEATRRVREWEREAASPVAHPIPIIALTANALNGEQERCLAAGMTDYASKPFDPLRLIDTIEGHLELVLQSRSSPKTVPPIPLLVPAFPDQAPERGPTRAPADVVDFQSLLKRCLGKGELAEKLFAKFRSRLPDELNQLEVALKRGDCDEVASLAHRLKGAAGNLSAEPLRELAANLEDLGRSGKLESVEIWMDRLRFEGGRILDHARPHSSGISAAPQKEAVCEISVCGDKPCAS